MQYPATRKGHVIDTCFGVNVPDPYRWLEDDRSPETAAWVREQNAVTHAYLDQIPYLDRLRGRLTTLVNYERESAPFREGRYTWFYRNTGLQNQDVLYRQLADGEPEVFLDPNSLSKDGTTSLAQVAFSKDGSRLAYAISEGGSDWRRIFVLDAETGATLEPPIVDVKFSGIDWRGNEGFYYSSYDKPDGSELSAKVDQHKLYFHQLDTPQSEDEVVFGDTPGEKRRYVSAAVTEDGRFLSILGSQTTSGNDLYIRDLRRKGAGLVPVLTSFDSDTHVVDSKGDKLFLKTNLDAPNGRVVMVDAADPTPANWVDVIPEAKDVLTLSSGGGFLFAEYMTDAISRIYQHDYAGNRLREIELPGLGSASSISGKVEDTTLYYSFTNYKTPPTIYAFDVASASSRIYRASAADFDVDAFISTQVFYSSKDGTRIPMIITHRTDVTPDGNNPTILYGYGGFDVSLTPAYSLGNALWLEQGGVLAVPNIRGGGEYGKAWHKAGTLTNKQNVFDDFIAAAEYLIDKGYTSHKHLALRGGSNGGLLVGAVMTQRPELAKVALPAVGVLDMLRYHTFTAGAGWAYDYGTAEDSVEMFTYLRGYSPLHNVKPGVSYPATLVTTSDHDDRVVPAHSFKFAATLQASQVGENPVLIRIETQAGHGAGTSISKQIEVLADVFGFAFFNLGVPPRLARD